MFLVLQAIAKVVDVAVMIIAPIATITVMLFPLVSVNYDDLVFNFNDQLCMWKWRRHPLAVIVLYTRMIKPLNLRNRDLQRFEFMFSNLLLIYFSFCSD